MQHFVHGAAAPIDQLRRALPDLPPRLRDAARYLAGHDFDAATRSMRDLAAAAGTHPATFTRLAQALGYAGWEELRAALIEARRPAPSAPFSNRATRPHTAAEPSARPLAAGMLEADAAALARLDPAPIEAAARALHAAPRLWAAGFRSCRGVAALLHYQLRLFRPDTVRLVGGAGPEDLDLGAFAAGDAVILTGFAPYSRASLLTARAARDSGCTLIALADTPLAPIAEGADHLLLFEAAAVPGFFPSLTGALATAQALAAAAFALGGEAALVRLRETESRLAALSQYLPDPEPQP
ncbi:MurR/RpiR family transcriptional regulator [Roseomonas sp. NAR14]|uniref:MurR/RpiR family transcriptional regulator n=1 Tax=Roseomonas acroporae TaxID=2937791 RepID=A0A9X2BXE4_9PROT|nr:MurR/RpiR family transcriptional regulator [Roseomonas acroporae]MCK8787136.1 MurR/RpiR family transcriptional regulator [Roseomonas acroporae]